jgi:hypothetical protein
VRWVGNEVRIRSRDVVLKILWKGKIFAEEKFAGAVELISIGYEII